MYSFTTIIIISTVLITTSSRPLPHDESMWEMYGPKNFTFAGFIKTSDATYQLQLNNADPDKTVNLTLSVDTPTTPVVPLKEPATNQDNIVALFISVEILTLVGALVFFAARIVKSGLLIVFFNMIGFICHTQVALISCFYRIMKDGYHFLMIIVSILFVIAILILKWKLIPPRPPAAAEDDHIIPIADEAAKPQKPKWLVKKSIMC